MRDRRIWTSKGKLRVEVVRDIAVRLKAGEPGHAIARAVGIPQATLWQTMNRIQKALAIKPTAVVWAEQREEIAQRYEAGEDLDQIADAMGLTMSGVRQRLLKMLGRATLPPLPLNETECLEVDRRLRTGESIASVARAIGCSNEAVKKRLTPEIVAYLTAAQPACPCGKRAGHSGQCLAHGPQVDALRAKIAAGELAAVAARELGMSLGMAYSIGRPFLAELRAAGRRCPCGDELGHLHRCASYPDRGGKVRYVGLESRVIASLEAGMTRAAIARAENVAVTTIIRIAAPKLARDAAAGVRCGCGRPVDHAGGCTVRTGRRRKKPSHAGLALDLTAYQRRRIAFHARRGRSDADIARRIGVSEAAVQTVVAGLVLVGQTMAGCRCGLPRNHEQSCRGTTTTPKPIAFKSGLAPATLAAVRRMYRSGMSIPQIAQRSDVSIGVVRRHVRYWLSNDLKVRSCECGRPARHAGRCSANNPRSLDARWHRHVHALILEGRTTREIADLYSLSFSSVLPHTRAARAELAAAGRTCACGRQIGHSGVCWATHEPVERASPVSEKTVARIKAALVGGQPDERIRKELEVSNAAITRVRQGLSKDERRRRATALALTDAKLFELIEHALPRRLSKADRDEITSDLFFGVRTGTVDVTNLKRAAIQILQRAFFAAKHAAPSLDETLFDDGSRTLADMIEDTTATAQIDEMKLGDGS